MSADWIWHSVAENLNPKNVTLNAVFTHLHTAVMSGEKIPECLLRQRDILEKMKFRDFVLIFRFAGPAAFWQGPLKQLVAKHHIEKLGDKFYDFSISFHKGEEEPRVQKEKSVLDYASDDESLLVL